MSEQAVVNKERVERMFSVGAHYGYARTRRHPSTSPYIFGNKEGLEIIDLEKTDALLEEAKAFAAKLGQEGKTLLFVGGKAEAEKVIEAAAEGQGQPYVIGRWIGGTLTNFSEVKKRLARLEKLRSQKEKGELSKYTKKERLMIDREIAKLEEKFGGMAGQEDLPQALFVVDPRFEHIAVREAMAINAPIIALANCDCDITNIDYPVVANDASRASITFFVEEIAKAYAEGKKAKKAEPAKTEATA